MQRHLHRQVVRFGQNPFADPDDEDMHIFATPDRPSEFLGYGPLMHYAMVQILERGRVLPGDFWLRQFERKGLAAIQGQWQKIEQVCLSHIKTAEVPSRVYEHIEDLLA